MPTHDKEIFVRIEPLRPGATILEPKSEGALRIGAEPGPAGGISVVIVVETENLGTFHIPANKWQVGVISAVCNWLLKLTAHQVADLRAQLEREAQERGDIQ